MIKKNTVTIPLNIKHNVAIMDLIENLEIPQTPWPLVQPEAKVVPNPTSNPPSTTKNNFFRYLH